MRRSSAVSLAYGSSSLSPSRCAPVYCCERLGLGAGSSSESDATRKSSRSEDFLRGFFCAAAALVELLLAGRDAMAGLRFCPAPDIVSRLVGVGG
jgi:hypothetical protein